MDVETTSHGRDDSAGTGIRPGNWGKKERDFEVAEESSEAAASCVLGEEDAVARLREASPDGILALVKWANDCCLHAAAYCGFSFVRAVSNWLM